MKDLKGCRRMVAEVCEDHDCLNQKQRETLGDLLWLHCTVRDADYVAVVNFLWNADEIDLLAKCDLLDLA